MKSLAVATALLFGAAARAGVRYTFSSVFGSFAVTTTKPLAKTTTFPAGRLIRPKGFLKATILSVTFDPNDTATDTLTVRESKGRTFTFRFRKRTFAAFGTTATSVGIRGRLALAKIPVAKPIKAR